MQTNDQKETEVLIIGAVTSGHATGARADKLTRMTMSGIGKELKLVLPKEMNATGVSPVQQRCMEGAARSGYERARDIILALNK